MRNPKFVDARARRHFRYAAVIGLCIGMLALAVTNRGAVGVMRVFGGAHVAKHIGSAVTAEIRALGRHL